jgi:two-component system sensor histidine kinase TctE
LLLLTAWIEYRLADSVTIQQDRQLLTLVPLFADSVQGLLPDGSATLAMDPDLAEYFKSRRDASGYALLNSDGRLLIGDEWLRDYPPTTSEPEFSSQEFGGVVYRIVTQRVLTREGELTVRLADGANVRLLRLGRIALKVVLPNVLLSLATLLAVKWAVRRALRPLLDLRHALEGRSLRDLTPLDAGRSPDEVRPLVQSLNRLFELVNAQAESQRRFVADAAHQLRTPLAGLQAQVEALAQPGHSGTSERILKLRAATRRTSQLANQLLALSRADAPSASAQPCQRVELKALCEHVLESHLDAAAARQIDLGMEAQAASAEGHDWLLRELMNNLVDNAIKYSNPGGHVTVRCGMRPPDQGAKADGAVQEAFLEVEDDGPGVPPAERARMLERFYRVPGSSGEGTGLGLAIADEIARTHHGQLRIASGRLGRGLCISVPLRAVRE